MNGLWPLLSLMNLWQSGVSLAQTCLLQGWIIKYPNRLPGNQILVQQPLMLSHQTGQGISSYTAFLVSVSQASFTIHPRKQYNSYTDDPLLANLVLVCTSPAVAKISTNGNQDAKINPHTPIPSRASSSLVPQTSPYGCLVSGLPQQLKVLRENL